MRNTVLFLAVGLVLGLGGLVAAGGGRPVRHDVALTIDREPGVVFPWVARPGRLPEWRRDVVSARSSGGGGLRPGALWRVTLAGEEGEREAELELTELVPGQRAAMILRDGGAETQMAFVLDAGEGRTFLSYRSETTHAGLLARLFAPLRAASGQAALREDLARLELRLETGTGE